METLSNVASAASKAVWGDSTANQEPISGVSGDTSKGEPYDAGNLDTREQKPIGSDSHVTDNTTTTNTTTSTTDDKTPLSDKIASTSSTTDTVTDKVDDPSSRSTESGPSNEDSTGHQNDTRHPDDVDTKAEEEKSQEAVPDVSGPGPKPLDTLAKEHGGDAGNLDKPATSSGGLDSADSAAGKDGAEDSSESKGTGEEYVKTTGFAADGGDFDATKPGAGREADRLMEGGGIAHGDGKALGGGDSSTDKSDKPSLSERIKSKFHKH